MTPNTNIDKALAVATDQPEAAGEVEVLPVGYSLPATLKQPSRELLKFLTEMKSGGAEVDPEAAAWQMIERILAARTVAELATVQEVTHARDILGVELRVTGFKWQESDFETGAGVYAVIDAVRLDLDRPVTVTCGATAVIATLYQLGLLDAFPAVVRLSQSSRPTKNNYYPINVELLADGGGLRPGEEPF